jgi:hypothetical protein
MSTLDSRQGGPAIWCVCARRAAEFTCDYPVRVERAEVRAVQSVDAVATPALAVHLCNRLLCGTCRRRWTGSTGQYDLCVMHSVIAATAGQATPLVGQCGDDEREWVDGRLIRHRPECPLHGAR